jgi:hypothetical protein
VVQFITGRRQRQILCSAYICVCVCVCVCVRAVYYGKAPKTNSLLWLLPSSNTCSSVLFGISNMLFAAEHAINVYVSYDSDLETGLVQG